MAHFTDREDQQQLFLRHLFSATESPVLMFYGIGGAGKTWLLKKLRDHVPHEVPKAFLDFDRTAGGSRFVQDPSAAIYEIRQQLDTPAPRFDLAFGVLRVKQGAPEETSFWVDFVAELAGFIPGAMTVLDRLSEPLLARLRGTALEQFLAVTEGQKFVLDLRAKTSQEIQGALLDYLAEDLRKGLGRHLNRAVSAVLFFDTFEAVSSGEQNEEHKRQYEQWVRDVASNLEFALIVIGGQNQLTWDEVDPAWKDHVEQHLVGGLSETDARRFLDGCGIRDRPLQDAILATAREEDGGHHCFSLGLCADVVDLERAQGLQTSPESLKFVPGDWERLARRFMKSLESDVQGRWIDRLALTPRFDESAARNAFSSEKTAAQDAAWETLQRYSFILPLPGDGAWFSIRDQMRWALENQPSAHERVGHDHTWWQRYWGGRSASPVDREASLAWYHQYCSDPEAAVDNWNTLAESARTSVPPRMSEHFSLLQWWEPIDPLNTSAGPPGSGRALVALGNELQDASLGSRSLNIGRAIACYEAALRVYTEKEFPQNWAVVQDDLGIAWSSMPTGDLAGNVGRAIACYEAALRVRAEKEFPQDWARTQNNLGAAWSTMPTGDRGESLGRAIACYEAALRMYTEKEFPQNWAVIQNNLGNVWRAMPTGDRGESLGRAIACYEAALRVYTEKEFPQNWARTQNYLGNAWSNMPTGDLAGNLGRAIAYYEAALRVYTEKQFPKDWAGTQNDLGAAWTRMPTGDRGENLGRAIACFEAALRVCTETEFPRDWAMTQNNLGNVWRAMPAGDRGENLGRAIACFEAALRVRTETKLPRDWALTQNSLGIALVETPAGDRGENLGRAVACFEAALRVFDEKKFPRDWAMIQNNLGNIWRAMPNGDRGENLARAIACYEAALRVRTEKEFPRDWAMTQDNLGAAWFDVLTGDRRENLGRVIACFEAALRVFTQGEFPLEWAETRNNLLKVQEELRKLAG
jgi:tetratricopeptide (TPR) repeat protein